MTTPRRLIRLSPALVLIALALPSSAFGQATRTWVSGVGDDANPCSRTAPCKTFAGAISKTAAGGEINCLDPGGFGGVTIGKSLAIKCRYTEGGILAAGVNGVVISAGTSDQITLSGLDIYGAAPVGNGAGIGGLVGVRVFSAASVNIVDSEIAKMAAGVAVTPTASGGTTRVLIARSHIHDNGVGVFNGPGNNTINATSVTLRNNDIADNTCGVTTSAFGPNGSPPVAGTDCGAAGIGSGISKTAVTSAYHNGIHDNATGGFVRGPAGIAILEVAYNEITGSSLFGLHRVDGATIRSTTPATNVISNNANSDAPNAFTTLSRKAAKKARAAAKKKRAHRV